MGNDRRQRRLHDRLMEKELDRRTFLRGVAAATAGAAIGGVAGCGDSSGGAADASNGQDSDASTLPDAPTGLDAPAALVGLVGMGRGSGTDGSVAFARDALDRAFSHTAGGLDFLSAGQSVFIKVNLNSGIPFPYTSSAATIEALVDTLFARGAGRVICGDRSFYGANSANAAVSSGIQAAAEGAGAEWMVFDENDSGFEWIQIPQAEAADWNGGFRIPAIFSQVDHIVHLPVLKTHFIAHYTMTVKLGFGSVHAGDRQVNLNQHQVSGGRLWRQIAQVGASYTPTLHVLDAQRPVITEGPNSGDTVDGYGLVFTSADPIATDATGLAVLGVVESPETQITSYGVWDQPQMAACVAAGLGISGPSAYSLAGDQGDAALAAIRDRVLG